VESTPLFFGNSMSSEAIIINSQHRGESKKEKLQHG